MHNLVELPGLSAPFVKLVNELRKEKKKSKQMNIS